MRPLDLNNYRHELGSLIDVRKEAEFEGLDDATRDLVLHLIAAHHGRARPHFPADEVFDPEQPANLVATIAREVPRRFARLQRRYGRWGLAYLESLLRAADIMASQEKLAERGAAPLSESSPGATR
jgi:CRISPR-associated endonuclease/helicase Cas3